MQPIEPHSTTSRTESAGNLRPSFVWICCLPLLALRLSILLTHHQAYDFVTYWSAGHLFLIGGHPYSEAAVFAIERMQGWAYPRPMMTFCPPWTLPALGILSVLPFHVAQSGWFAISLVLDCFSAIGLWIYFGGAKRSWWIGLLVATTFLPMGAAELLGQITPLMLASLTAFLLLLRSERYFWAGTLLLGFGFKPHLLYLVDLAIFFWIVKKRAWSMLTGAALSYCVATAAAQLYNPHSLDYLQRSFQGAIEISCGLGGALRSTFGVQHQWLQFLPCVFGVAWFLLYRLQHREDWSWQTHLPLVLVVSIASSPYYWFHDFVLILPALIALAVRGGHRKFNTLVAYLALQVIIVAFGLTESWMSAVSALWIAFYCIAVEEAKRSGNRIDPAAVRYSPIAEPQRVDR